MGNYLQEKIFLYCLILYGNIRGDYFGLTFLIYFVYNDYIEGRFMKKLKEISLFKDVTKEAAFLDEHDVTEYFDISQVKRTHFANLKKTT